MLALIDLSIEFCGVGGWWCVFVESAHVCVTHPSALRGTQAFWTQAPGLFIWISGGSAGAGGAVEGTDSVAQKEGALDALAALDVIVEVAKTGKGALVLASHSFMLFLRQGPLNTRVLRTDAEQLPLYVGSGNSRYRNLWHQVSSCSAVGFSCVLRCAVWL